MSRDALLIVGIVAWGIAGGLAYGAIQLLRFSEAHGGLALYSALAGVFAVVAAVAAWLCVRAGIQAPKDSGGNDAA